MSDYKKRLKSERELLGEKLEKLEYFLTTANSDGVSKVDMELLKLQAKAMSTYLCVLNSRIELMSLPY